MRPTVYYAAIASLVMRPVTIVFCVAIVFFAYRVRAQPACEAHRFEGRSMAERFSPPHLLETIARLPCRTKDGLACTRQGTFSRLRINATVLNQVGGHVNVTNVPVHHLGTRETDRHRFELDRPHVCLEEDYCVGIPENVTFSLYVSRVKSVYALDSWLNQIAFETVEERQVDIAASNATLVQAMLPDLAPLVDCEPRLMTTEGNRPSQRNAVAHNCQSVPDGEFGEVRRLTLAEIEAASGCNMTLADALPSDGVWAQRHYRVCTGVVCPECGAASQTTADLLQLHRIGDECTIRAIRSLPRAMVEVRLEVTNHDTGKRVDLYTTAFRGRTGPVQKAGTGPYGAPMRMTVDMRPRSRRENAHSPVLGDSVVVCGERRGRVESALFQPWVVEGALPAAAIGRIPVPTRSYFGDLHQDVDQEIQPFWYWLPADQYHGYGRRCGERGAGANTVFWESGDLLEDLCYTANFSCIDSGPRSPCRISAELNAYSQNGAVLSALRGAPGSDPSLIESERPANMPPREIWNDLCPKTYLTRVHDRTTRGSPQVTDALVVEETGTTEVTDEDLDRGGGTAHDLLLTLDIGDTVLPDPLATRENHIYTQRLSVSQTTCSAFTNAQSGWGGLSMTFCTPVDVHNVRANGGVQQYVARVECDPSVGSMVSGYANTLVLSDTVAHISFEAAVGGPAGQCTTLPNPVAFEPSTSSNTTHGHDFAFQGKCRVTLHSGLEKFGHVQIGEEVEVQCTRFQPEVFHPRPAYALFGAHVSCGFWNSDAECDNYGVGYFVITLIVIGAVIAALLLALFIAYVVMETKKRNDKKAKTE